MADEFTTEEVQAATSDTPEQAQAAAPDDFDKDRAMATISKLRGFEKDAKAKLKRLEELEAAEQQRSEKDLSEAQRLQKELEKLSAAHTEAQAKLRRHTLLDAARSAASKQSLSFHDGALADALQLGAFDALEIDDDGQVKDMSNAVKNLAKERPYLLKPATSPSADLDGVRRGSTTKEQHEADKRTSLAQRFGLRNAG